jgi:hypothetical protein
MKNPFSFSLSACFLGASVLVVLCFTGTLFNSIRLLLMSYVCFSCAELLSMDCSSLIMFLLRLVHLFKLATAEEINAWS